jgi:hypothetical protein
MPARPEQMSVLVHLTQRIVSLKLSRCTDTSCGLHPRTNDSPCQGNDAGLAFVIHARVKVSSRVMLKLRSL